MFCNRRWLLALSTVSLPSISHFKSADGVQSFSESSSPARWSRANGKGAAGMPARADALQREGRGLSPLPIVCHFILFGSGFFHS